MKSHAQQPSLSSPRRLRFSVRVLLVVVTVVAVILAMVGKRVLEARKQRQLVELIQSCGGEHHHELNYKDGKERTIRFPNMDFSPQMPGPDWLRGRIGDEYFVDVAEAFFDRASHRIVDDSTFLEFARAVQSRDLPRPRGLVFADLPITDESLEALGVFPDLTSLHILNCPRVTEEGLKHLESLSKLRRLDIRGTPITDRGLGRLSGLRKLRELAIKPNAVTEAGLLQLKEMNELEWLSLGDSAVTSESVRALRKHLPNCEMSW